MICMMILGLVFAFMHGDPLFARLFYVIMIAPLVILLYYDYKQWKDP